MNCYVHSEREAVGVCVSCGKPICAECKVLLRDKYYCNPCVDKLVSGKTETNFIQVENTSGQGKLAVFPHEAKGYNWGAILLGIIWGAGNNVWWSLPLLVPYFNFIWLFVMGAKGNEWAWRSKKWDSIEHFQRTQKKWCYWGIGVTIVAFVIGFIIALSVYSL